MNALICDASLFIVSFYLLGVVAIAEYIAANYTIARIDLRDNNIQMAGLMALSLAMKNSESVIKLDIGEIALTCDNFDNDNKLKFKHEIDERCRKNAIEVDEQPFVQVNTKI